MVGKAHPSSLKLIAVMFAGPVVFLGLLPWIDEQSDAIIYTFAALASVWTLAFSLIITLTANKSADEWTQAGSRFSSFWGGIAGTALTALMLTLPPFHTLLGHLTAWSQNVPVDVVDQTTLILAFTAGFVTVVLLQTLCALTFYFIWRRRTLGHSE